VLVLEMVDGACSEQLVMQPACRCRCDPAKNVAIKSVENMAGKRSVAKRREMRFHVDLLNTVAKSCQYYYLSCNSCQ